jgi:hypothetical protein
MIMDEGNRGCAQGAALADIPHLLEWYASYCITIAEDCTSSRANKLLRLLAVDLALEAQKHRLEARKRKLTPTSVVPLDNSK